MIGWWQNLSQRERIMLAAMVAVLVLALLALGIVRPLVQWRDGGRVALESAETTAMLVDRAVANAGAATAGGATGGELRGIVTAYAGEYEIPVSAFQLTQSGASVIISIEDVSSNRLFAWLGRLAEERNIHVTEARITPARAGSGGVQARVTLGQGG